jgi:hypothetical protein
MRSRLPSLHLIVIAVLLVASAGCKKKPVDVKPNDQVQCCFFVPYEGLNGQMIQAEQCRVELVCAQAGEVDTKDVCEPLACKTGDVNPYDTLGPGGASITVGNCTVDYGSTVVIPDGCPAEGSGARGMGTDQPLPPPPAPGEGSGADSTGT